MIDPKYLPSKKFLTALSVSVVIILIAIIFNYWKPNTTSYINSDFATDTSQAVVNIDSDHDGLVDWKENLYGTDPKMSDTDKDGTNDVEEIAQNRDPLKANTVPEGQEPNDKLDPAIVEEDKKKLEEYERLNALDKLSRNLVSNIIATQPADGSMSQDSANLILNKALGEIPEKNFNGITKISDLTLLKTDSSNLNKNMTAYKNSYSAETKVLESVLGSEMIMIDSLISDINTSAKSEMLKLIDKYQNVVENLIKIPVPVAIGYYDINYHLKLINDLEILIAVDKDIVNSSDGSLNIFSDLVIYKNTMDDLFSTLTKIDTIFKVNR